MKKIRQYQIAKQAGISAPMFCEIINGKARPSWGTAKRIASVTGTTPDIWMEGQTDVLRQIINNIPEATNDLQ